MASLLVAIFALLHIFAIASGRAPQPRFFNVMSYGANSDGRTDNSQAFLKAWGEACQWNNGNAQNIVLIPEGTFKVNSAVFSGPCKSRMVFLLQGVLTAPTNPYYFYSETWIAFRYIDGLVVRGGGTIDGQGALAWPYNDCATNRQCKNLPVSLRFDFVNDARVINFRSINPKNAHLTMFKCNNVNITKIRLTAPDQSPNTDGIKIGMSTNIRISRALIGTGDDCIALINGSENIDISDVLCGPGHGISIGSLGNREGVEFVKGVMVRNCSFVSTDNGVRIKTRPSPFPSFVSDVTFTGITMTNVRNPIFIDQQYCPARNCRYENKGNAGVRINRIKFDNIWGSSSSEVAINLQCAPDLPCQGVKLGNINLAYIGSERQALSSCYNARVQPYGRIDPPGC